MRTIVLKVIAHGDSLLKIVWVEGEYSLPFPPYFVHRQQLEDSVWKCRRTLEGLVAAFVEGDKSGYAPVLRELSARGAELYYLLFMGAAENSETAANVQNWIAELEGPLRLIVSSDASIHVPWGLVFSGDEALLPNGVVDIDDFRDFWAIKYQLTVLYTGMSPRSLQRARPRETFRMLSVLNRDAFDSGFGSLAPDKQSAFAHFLERPEGSAYTFDECRQKWALMKDCDCMLYFFAHATGTEIELSDQDRISVVQLRQRFMDPRRRARGRVPECLVVLNGCNTAVGDLDNSFLTATAEAGCCGFIGTEAPVPATFAMLFGLELLQLLLGAGMSVIEAIDRLRRQDWPLGLLYGCYAHPDFRVEPDSAIATPFRADTGQGTERDTSQ